ncbi:MAG: S8 family serine peptidase, partial [Bacteroidota bacterium]
MVNKHFYPQQFLMLLIAFFAQQWIAQAQNPNQLYGYHFNSAPPTNWTITDVNASNGIWTWANNGKADNGTYWNGRDRIRSKTEEGAMVMDGDYYASVGTSGATPPFKTELISPVLDFTGEPVVYLSFHQYFRYFDATTSVGVSTNGGVTWTDFSINSNLNINVETGPRAYEVIDISSVAANTANVQVRFFYEGEYYFWIIDDVEFWDGQPYPATLPGYMRDSLVAFNYPYEVDAIGSPYVSGEILVQFQPGISNFVKNQIRDEFGVYEYTNCVCARVERWFIDNDLIVGDSVLNGDGKSISIFENAKDAAAKSEVDDADLNYYIPAQMDGSMPLTNNPLDHIPPSISSSSDNAIKIAIIDTGIDFNHPLLSNSIWRVDPSRDSYPCAETGEIGWNFMDKNNNPSDNHPGGHGTHVSGIVDQNIGLDACDYKLLAVKTHDARGVASLYEVLCGIYYSVLRGADIANMSFGFAADSPVGLLQNALDTGAVYNTLFIAAAGNDAKDLANVPYYPACLENDNLITVASVDSVTFQLSEFSNFGSTCVDIAATGNNIISTVPGPGPLKDTLSGTSMAAPIVAAAAVLAHCGGVTDYADVQDNIFSCAQLISGSVFDDAIEGDRLVQLESNCLGNDGGFHVNPADLAGFKILPNPASGSFSLVPEESL